MKRFWKLIGFYPHGFCELYWRIVLGAGRGDWHLNAEKYGQCNRCGWVDKSVRFDLPETDA